VPSFPPALLHSTLHHVPRRAHQTSRRCLLCLNVIGSLCLLLVTRWLLLLWGVLLLYSSHSTTTSDAAAHVPRPHSACVARSAIDACDNNLSVAVGRSTKSFIHAPSIYNYDNIHRLVVPSTQAAPPTRSHTNKQGTRESGRQRTAGRHENTDSAGGNKIKSSNTHARENARPQKLNKE
jgi:hypothetical protein